MPGQWLTSRPRKDDHEIVFVKKGFCLNTLDCEIWRGKLTYHAIDKRVEVSFQLDMPVASVDKSCVNLIIRELHVNTPSRQAI